MCEQIQAFVDSAAEAFRLRGPLYRFADPFGQALPRESALPKCLAEGGCIDVELCDTGEIDRSGFPDGAARTVLCVGALEFSYQPQQLAAELTRILAPGGALLIAAPALSSGSDSIPGYWQLTPRSVERFLDGMVATMVGWQGSAESPHTVYGLGFKAPLAGAFTRGTSRFLESFQARLRGSAERGGWSARFREIVRAWLRGRPRRRPSRDYHELQFALHLRVDRSVKHDLLQMCLSEGMTGGRVDLME